MNAKPEQFPNTICPKRLFVAGPVGVGARLFPGMSLEERHESSKGLDNSAIASLAAQLNEARFNLDARRAAMGELQQQLNKARFDLALEQESHAETRRDIERKVEYACKNWQHKCGVQKGWFKIACNLGGKAMEKYRAACAQRDLIGKERDELAQQNKNHGALRDLLAKQRDIATNRVENLRKQVSALGTELSTAHTVLNYYGAAQVFETPDKRREAYAVSGRINDLIKIIRRESHSNSFPSA